MAVNTPDKNKQKKFTTKVADGLICISAPAYFIDLARETLSGWEFLKEPYSMGSDILISYKNDLFYVDSITLDKPKIVDDLLDALNEFFLCLSYLVVNKNPSYKLLHCASYSEAGKNVILLGSKKSGKSQQTLSKSIEGRLIYADDLLLWSPKQGKFTSLGLPLRLRRLSASLMDDSFIESRFFIGKNILYSHHKFFNNAEFGDRFLLDELYIMNRNFGLDCIPIYKFTSYLKQYLISDFFLSTKKSL